MGNNIEFIAWNSSMKIFSEFAGEYQIRHINNIEGLTFFQYVGKTDTEGNKIYADCSIVEFDIFDGGEQVKMQGYFHYNLDELRQEIYITESPSKSFWSVLSYDEIKMSNLRVIGTLQENLES